MALIREELYQILYENEMIREPGNPSRKDTPLKSISEVSSFADKCGGVKPAFMSIYSYKEPYKVEYKSNSKGEKKVTRIVEYPPIVFDRIILDFDIDKEELLFKEGYNSQDILDKGKELIEQSNKELPKGKQKGTTKRHYMVAGREYYSNLVKQHDQDNVKELTRKCKTKKEKHDAVMEYYYNKYTSNEYLITPYKEAIKTAQYIKDMFNLTPILFFSGGHGIHLHLLFNTVDVPNPNDIVKEFGFKLKKELDLQTLDTTVVQGVNKHLIRIPLSRHQTTKLYVTPFDLNTSYFEMLDNSMFYAENSEVLFKNITDQDTTIFEDFIKSYSKFLEETKAKPKTRNIEHEYTLNGSLMDLQEPFSRLYIEGQRNYTAHPLIHFLKGANIPKEEVEQFFDTLPVGPGLDNNVQTWIDTAYNTDKPYQTNIGYFINTVKNYAINEEDADHIIKKFNEYFNPKGKEVTTKLSPFTIGTDAREYPVEATLVGDRYTQIQIKDLFENKSFRFVFDIKNNVCKFASDNGMVFEFKYKFNPGGFKIQSKTEFNSIKKNIADILNIKIPDAFEYSLSSYLSDLYDEIEEKNSVDLEATAEALDIDIDSQEIRMLIASIQANFSERTRTNIEEGRRQLSKLLTDYYGVILRKHIGTLYKINGNGYEPTSHDDLIRELTTVFGKNFIHDNDLKNALGYISDRLEPEPNIVKFENTLFDMDTLTPIESETPIFTVLNIPYKYNPDAQSSLFKQFLSTTFERDTEEETNKAVKGIKQLCGYFLTSGNSEEILPIFTGLTGAGKSTLLNIITGIFGHEKISGISLQSLENDIHASSGFVGKHLNIIRDSDVTMIKNNAILKTWTGNEGYPVNPKFKDLFDLPAHEVPKPILACNTMPVFAVYDDAIIRRFVIVEFLVSMTKQGKAITDLDKKILADKEEVEWFIFESIKEYKAMKENEKDDTFVFKISDEETKELIEKHTHPLNHIIQQLIMKHDPEAYDSDKFSMPKHFKPVFTNDLVDTIIYVANDKGIDVPVNKHGKIDKKTLLSVIKDEFDLHDGEIVKDRETGQYKKHREYTARAERFEYTNAKAYPNLIATEYYIQILTEVEKQRKKEMRKKAEQ